MIYLISDPHWFHKNVIKYSKRPFKDVDEMNETLIRNWNSVVKWDDEIYILGDLFFCGSDKMNMILDRLNGRKYLILGNHDQEKILVKTGKFEWIKNYHEMSFEDKNHPRGQNKIIMFHFPIHEWNGKHHGTFHLCGHSHPKSAVERYDLRRINVGVDCREWNYTPVSLERLKTEFFPKFSMPGFDHHGNKVNEGVREYEQ